MGLNNLPIVTWLKNKNEYQQETRFNSLTFNRVKQTPNSDLMSEALEILTNK